MRGLRHGFLSLSACTLAFSPVTVTLPPSCSTSRSVAERLSRFGEYVLPSD